MGLEDLNPYGKAGLQSFESRTLNSMDASLDVPRVTDYYSNYGAVGTDQLATPDLNSFALGIQQAAQKPPEITEPSVGFNQTTNQVFVNGLTFDADDYQTADRSATPEFLGRVPTGLPDGFMRMSPELYAEYIKDIRDPGLFRFAKKNIGIGADNLQNFYYSGAAFLGDAIGSETLSEFGREGIEQQTEDLRRKEPFNYVLTEDVDDVESGIKWFVGQVAQQGPNLLESMAAFLVGAGAATVATGNPLAGVVSGIGAALKKGQFRKRIMDIVAKKRRGEALDQGDYALIKGVSGIAASLGNSYRTGVSDTYLQLLESAEMEDPGAGQRLFALAAGVPYALAETASEAFVVSKFLNPAKASSTFRRVLSGFGSGAAAEGLAEGAQESIVMGSDAFLNEKEFLTEQNGIQLINAIASGAAVGGPITGLSGLRKNTPNEVNLLDNSEMTGVTDEGGGTPAQGELFAEDDLGTAPEIDPDIAALREQDEALRQQVIADLNQAREDQLLNEEIRGVQNQPPAPIIAAEEEQRIRDEIRRREIAEADRLDSAMMAAQPLSDRTGGVLPDQGDLFPLGNVQFNPNLNPETDPDPDPDEGGGTDAEPDTIVTPKRKETQIPLFAPGQAPKKKPPKRPLTDDIPQSQTEFNPSTVPQLVDRRDKKDLPATAKGENQISGGKQEGAISDPVSRKKELDRIDYVAPDMGVIPPQVMQDKYAAAMRKIKLVDAKFKTRKKKGTEPTKWKGAHHNGGIALRTDLPFSQPITADLIAHELGHASHSLLGDQINNNPEVLAELQAIEQTLYPGLRAIIEQAINDGKKLDNEFFNYLLSPEELIAEFNVFRLKQPEQAAQIAPVLSQLLESVEQAPNLVVDRKTFPTGFGTIVTKTTGNFNGDLNLSINQQDQKIGRKNARLKKGVKKEEVKDAVQESETETLDAQEQAEDGKGVGEEVQKTTRVRTKKKSLKKEKVEESGVQTDKKSKPKVEALKRGKVTKRTYVDEEGVTRTQLLQDGRVVSDVAGKSADLKNLGTRKVERVTGTAAAKQTKKPQRVDKREPVETLDIRQQWDANRPSEDAPKREDFPVNLRGELDKLTAEEARDAWTNTNNVLEKLPDSVATTIIIYSLDNTKMGKPGSLVAQQMESMFTYLLDVSLTNTDNKEGRDYLANFKVERPEFRDAVTRVVPFALAQGNLNSDKNTLWFDVAVNVGALPSLKRLLKTDAAFAKYNEIESATFSSEQIIENNIQANEQELTSFGGMSAAIYSDPNTGPTQLSRKLATLIGKIRYEIIKSENSPEVQQLNRLYQGTAKVKPDLTYQIDGKPLSDYFDDSGKLKLRPHNTFKINRLGKEYPVNGFKLSPVSMKENRILNLMAEQITQEDLNKARKEIEGKELSVEERETFESMLAGYMGEANRRRAQDMVRMGQVKLFNPKSKGSNLRKGEILEGGTPILDTEVNQDADLDDALDAMGLKAELGRTLLFDGDKPVKPMSIGRAKLVAQNVVNKFAVKPKLTVVKDLVDLQRQKPELYDRVLNSRPDIENKNLMGFSIGTDVIIFSDFIHSENHLKFTLAHETIGHFGLRSLVSQSQLNSFLDNVYNTSPFIREQADIYMENHGADKHVAIEEALANYAAVLDNSVLERVANFIRKLLNKIGVKMRHDEAPYYVNQLRRYVRNGEIPGGLSPKQLALNIQELNNSNVGMFSQAATIRVEDGLGQLFAHTGTSTLKGLSQTIGSRKLSDNMGRAAEQVQTLDNMANKSLLVSKMFDIFRRQAQTAKSIMSELDNMTKVASRARWLGLNNNALSKEEEVIVGKLLAYGNAHISQNMTESKMKEYGDIIIQDPITGRPILNQGVLAQALQDAVLTDDQIKNGFTFEQGGAVQQSPITIPDFDPVNNPRHKLIKEAYLAQRQAINYVSARVALGKYLSAIKQYEGTREKIKSLSDQFTETDLGAFAEIQKAFVKIYQANARQSDGKMRPTTKGVKDSEAFLNGITRALWQDGAIADLEAMKSAKADDSKPTQQAINIINEWNKANPNDQIDLTQIVASLKRMRRYDLSDPDTGATQKREQIVMNKIQKPIKNQVFTETQLMNANVYAKQSIFTAYTPYRRSGKNQLRFQAYDSAGNPTKIDSRFAAAFPYYQDDNRSTLIDLAKQFNSDIENTTFTVPASNNPEDKSTVTVTMRAVVEDSTGGTNTVTSFNYDEFANVLNNLGIDLDPLARERIVVQLSRQHDKARSGLMKEFVPGWDQDVFRAVAEHLESQAAVAAKNEHRTDIDIVMSDPNNARLPKKFVQEAYNELEAARQGNNQDATHIAQEKFDRLLRMYIETAGETPGSNAADFRYKDKYGKDQVAKPKGKGNRYLEKSAELLEFYASHTDLAISAEDAFSKSDTLSQFKSLAVLFQLGGNLASGFINLTSQPLMALPLMAYYNTKTGIGGGYGMIASSTALVRANIDLKNPKWGDPIWIKENIIDNNDYGSYGLTEDEAQFLYRQTNRGILDAALVNSLAGRARGNFFQNGTATAVSRGYMSAFAITEQLNRRATALATYRLEKRRRMAADPKLKDSDFLIDDQLSDIVLVDDNPDLFYIEDKVNEMVTKSQGDYAMYNRPPIARGNWAQYLYMYKQFQVIATQLVRVLPPAGRAYYLSALFLAAGLKGLPGAEDLLDIVDTLRQKFGKLFGFKGTVPSEVILGKFIEDMTGGVISTQVATRGFADQFMGGGTIGSRLSIGDLFPMTGIFLAGSSTVQELKNFAGPLFSASYGGAVMAYDLAMLPTKTNTMNELMRIGQNSPIAGLRNLSDTAMYLSTGDVVNAKGYTVVKDVGTGTTVMRMLGFYPKEASKVNDAIRITKRIVDDQKAITKGYRDEWVRAFLMKDRRGMRAVERAVKEHNKAQGKKSPFIIDDFKSKAKRAAKSASEGAGARFLKTTPKSTRDNISSLIEDFYGVDLD